jgi:hypothetical protein
LIFLLHVSQLVHQKVVKSAKKTWKNAKKVWKMQKGAKCERSAKMESKFPLHRIALLQKKTRIFPLFRIALPFLAHSPPRIQQRLSPLKHVPLTCGAWLRLPDGCWKVQQLSGRRIQQVNIPKIEEEKQQGGLEGNSSTAAHPPT